MMPRFSHLENSTISSTASPARAAQALLNLRRDFHERSPTEPAEHLAQHAVSSTPPSINSTREGRSVIVDRLLPLDTESSSIPISTPQFNFNEPSFLQSVADSLQRIVHAPVLNLPGPDWMEEEASSTSTNRNSADGSEGVRGAAVTSRLTRTYTGRPHVPGEDSGSDSEDEAEETEETEDDFMMENTMDSTMDSMMSNEDDQGNTRTAVHGSDFTTTRDRIVDEHRARRQQAILRIESSLRSRSRSQSSLRRLRLMETAPAFRAEISTAPTGNRIGQIPMEENAQLNSERDAYAETSLAHANARISTPVQRPEMDTRATILERTGQARRDLEQAHRDVRNTRRMLQHQVRSDRAVRSVHESSNEDEVTQALRQAAEGLGRLQNRFDSVMAAHATNIDNSRVLRERFDSLMATSRVDANDFRTLRDRYEALVTDYNAERRRASTTSPRTRDANLPAVNPPLEAQGVSAAAHREIRIQWERLHPPSTAVESQNSDDNWSIPPQNDESVAVGPLFSRDRTTIFGSGVAAAQQPPNTMAAYAEAYRNFREASRRRRKDDNVLNTEAGRAARQKMKYLSALKHCGGNKVTAWELAKIFKIDASSAPLDDGSFRDLPYSIDELPDPSESSWLEPGMSWKGVQCAGTMDEDAKMLHARARRHRSRLRRERLDRLTDGVAIRQFEDPDRQSSQELFERSLISGANNSLATWNESMRVLEDAERQLSQILLIREQSHGADDGWGQSTSIDGDRARLPLNSFRNSRTDHFEYRQTQSERGDIDRDHWPAEVTIHSVDWKAKTLCGTMSASQIPGRSKRQPQRDSNTIPDLPDSDQPTTNKTTDSFFYGEIVDFRNFDLETSMTSPTHASTPNNSKSEWKVGGIDTDIRYWAGVGPFRTEVEQILEAKRREKGLPKGEEKFCGDVLSEDEKNEVKDEVFGRRIGDKTWLQDVLAKDWILMRWKEQCFVTSDPTPNPPALHSSSTLSPTSLRSRVWTTTYSQDTSNTSSSSSPINLGLTISGFYYIALHRQSGRLEGLYYDPDSQPFQKLRLIPRDCMGNQSVDVDWLEKLLIDQAVDNVDEAMPKYTFLHSEGHNNGPARTGPEAMMELGIKRSFPVVEFR